MGPDESTDARDVLRREAEARRNSELWADDSTYDVFGERIIGQDDSLLNHDDAVLRDESMLADDELTPAATGSSMADQGDFAVTDVESEFHETLIDPQTGAQLEDDDLAVDDSDLTTTHMAEKDESFSDKIRDKARELRDKI